MSDAGFEGSKQTEGDAGANPACVDLVPVAPELRWTPVNSFQPRPDACFVTQLIATAEQAPQTRTLRRATSADARTAYTASQHPVYGVGVRTRQTI
jgi:hypothetical protein